MQFAIGTTNPFKVAEIASILNPLGIPLMITPPIDPEETESTFMGNAGIKATAYGRYIGDRMMDELVTKHGCSSEVARTFLKLQRVYTICEDSGLEVSALGGLPGPWSARFDDCVIQDGIVIGHTSSSRPRMEIDSANIERVLRMMDGKPLIERAARFVVALIVADIDGTPVFQTERDSVGWISLQRSAGIMGFGYDPIFSDRHTGDGNTWADIDLMRKNLISHRRKALGDFTTWLARELMQEEFLGETR